MDNDVLAILQIVVATVTACATIGLVYVTVVLARATKAMARASSTAMVTAMMEPNVWSLHHCDLVVHNSGNGPAYNVEIGISPEILQADVREGRSLPMQNIEVIRPGQQLRSYLTDVSRVLDQDFKVTVRWKEAPDAQQWETISYDHFVPKDVSLLGASSPVVQVAAQIKKLREDWKPVSQGSRRLEVNAHSGEDRRREEEELQKWREEQKKRMASGQNA